MEHTNVKILAISDVPSKALWDYDTRARLEGIDLILSCGDLPKKYLEYLTNFTAAPILYVHGNHDGSYQTQGEPGGCICVDDQVYTWKGLRIMGLGGCQRYNKEDTYQYNDLNQMVSKHTRTSQALIQAGIPRSQWNAVNQTGNAFSESLLSGQLNRNKLTSEGISTVRPSGGQK